MLKRMAALVCALVAVTARGQSLEIGDPAPPLGDHVRWLKGEPVPQFQKGQVYVLDFWATWCGPCVATMPHMSELAKAHKAAGVNVIGLAIWPREGMAPTADFVKKRGEQIAYSIAEDVDAAISTKYMTASGTHSIPTVMIVDRDGAIAWMGHPLEGLDETLVKVLNGKHDGKRLADLNRKGEPMLAEANTLAETGRWDESFAIVDQVIALDHEHFGHYAVKKYTVMLARLGWMDKAKEYGRKATREIINKDHRRLNDLSWFIVDSPLQDKDLDLAQEAAEAAVRLTDEKEPAYLDTLATVFALRGDYEKAARTQRKAVNACTDTETKADMQTRLTEYEQESKAAKSGK